MQAKHGGEGVGKLRTGSNNSLASKDVLGPKSSRFTVLAPTLHVACSRIVSSIHLCPMQAHVLACAGLLCRDCFNRVGGMHLIATLVPV